MIDTTKMAAWGAKMAATEATTTPQQQAASSPSAAAGEGGVRGRRCPRATLGLSDHWAEGIFYLAGSPGSGRPYVVLK